MKMPITLGEYLEWKELKMSPQEYVTKEDLIKKLRELVREAGTQLILAREIGISDQYLSDILSNKRDPGAAVMKFLKVEKVILYREIK